MLIVDVKLNKSTVAKQNKEKRFDSTNQNKKKKSTGCFKIKFVLSLP